MKIEYLNLMEGILQWKIRRTQRMIAEQRYNNFTGHLDIMELHVPYTQYDLVFNAFDVTDKRIGNKILVLAGDNLNLDLFSRYWHRSKERTTNSSPWKELQTLVEVLRVAQQVYDQILYMETNHDKRMYKLIDKSMEEKQQAEEMCNFIKPIKEIFEENNLHKITVVPDQIFQVGEILICHFENNSKVPGSVPRALVKYMIPRIQKPWKVVFEAHTHYQCKIMVMGKVCIETGAMCYSQDYWQVPKIKSEEKVPSIGYATCDLIDGIVDINTANFVFCDWDKWI